MTIDEMKVGQAYTIHYRVGKNVEEFPGCRFEGIALSWFDGGGSASSEVRGVVAYRANTTPRLAYFAETRIVDIDLE